MPANNQPGGRKWTGKALAIAGVVLLILSFVVYRARGASFQWGLFLSTLSGVNWKWLTVCIVLMLLTYVGRALRWEVMLRPLGVKVSIRKLTYDTAIGFTAVVLLGRAGEVVRPYLIAVSAGVSFSSQMAAWMLERMLDLLAVLLVFGFVLARIPSHQGATLGPALRWALEAGGYLIAAIGAAVLLLLILFRNFSASARRRLLSAVTFLPANYYKRVEGMLAAFSEGMESTRDLRSLMLLVFYTVLEWTIIIAGYYTLFMSFPVTNHFTLTDVVIFLGFVAFGGLVQIPGIGGGVQVVAFIVLREMYHLPIEAASGTAFLIWIATFVVVVPFGLLCAFVQGLNWSKLKQLPKDVPR